MYYVYLAILCMLFKTGLISALFSQSIFKKFVFYGFKKKIKIINIPTTI